jgi:hypothetical protein
LVQARSLSSDLGLLLRATVDGVSLIFGKIGSILLKDSKFRKILLKNLALKNIIDIYRFREVNVKQHLVSVFSAAASLRSTLTQLATT